jgi:uncharacterized protein (TIGR03437 family)
MTRNRFWVLLAVLASPAYSADFTAYIGDQNQYQVAAIATDSAGNTYVTGSRIIQVQPGDELDDVFVTKLDANGNILFTTTFGGKGSDQGNAIALDSAGNIWVGGSTSSEDFPLRGAVQTAMGPGGSGFLVKLAPDGTVIYSTYFGGLVGSSSVNGLAADQGNGMYVTGTTDSKDFTATPDLPLGTVSSDEITPVYGAFIAKFGSLDLIFIYSALIAGSSVDCSGGSSCFLMERDTSGTAITVDAAGEAIMVGNTNTTDLPVTPGGTAGYGAFAVKINSEGSQLVYLTYLGPADGLVTLAPPQTITATAIATDAAGDAYLTGYTNDPLFPATTGAYQTSLGANATNAFAIELDPAGKTKWGTYLGGAGPDRANSISLDNSDDVWLAGSNAAGFPIKTSVFNGSGVGDFLAELNPVGSSLLYSAEFPSGTAGQSIAVDPSGVVHVAGAIGLISTILPAQPFASPIFGIMNAAAGPLSGRIAPGEVISIFGSGLGPATPVTAAPVNGAFPQTLGGVVVLVDNTVLPLLYVSASQINAEIPAPLSLNATDSAVIEVRYGSSAPPQFHVSVDATIWGIFQNPDGSAKAINQDGSVNSASNPAKAGSIVSIWATGFGNDAGPITGAVPTAPFDDWCLYCQITIAGVTETVEYGGAAPGMIDGIMQVNLMIPALAEAVQNPVELDFQGATATLYVSE